MTLTFSEQWFSTAGSLHLGRHLLESDRSDASGTPFGAGPYKQAVCQPLDTALDTVQDHGDMTQFRTVSQPASPPGRRPASTCAAKEIKSGEFAVPIQRQFPMPVGRAQIEDVLKLSRAETGHSPIGDTSRDVIGVDSVPGIR